MEQPMNKSGLSFSINRFLDIKDVPSSDNHRNPLMVDPHLHPDQIMHQQHYQQQVHNRSTSFIFYYLINYLFTLYKFYFCRICINSPIEFIHFVLDFFILNLAFKCISILSVYEIILTLIILKQYYLKQIWDTNLYLNN